MGWDRKASRLTVCLTEKAEQGRANAELVRELSKALGAPVEILRGQKGRRKLLRVGLPLEEIRRRAGGEWCDARRSCAVIAEGGAGGDLMRAEPREEHRLRQKWKKFGNLLMELEESGAEVLVEGKRDRIALQKVGIGNRITLISRRPDDVAADVATRAETAAVMTDFDDAGEELAHRMVEALESHSVKPDLDARRKLRALFGVRFFEELDRKVLELKEKIERYDR